MLSGLYKIIIKGLLKHFWTLEREKKLAEGKPYIFIYIDKA